MQIQVLTYATDLSKARVFLDSAKRFCAEVHPLGVGTKWRGFSDKAKGLREYLNTYAGDGLILFMDGYDSVFAAPLSKIIEVYMRDFYPQVVFSTERNCWPDGSLRDQYPTPVSGSLYRYLNSGGFIGPVDTLREMVNKLPDHSSEQGQWTLLYLSEPEQFTLDTECVLFQSTFDAGADLVMRGNRVYNQLTKTYPLTVHANGGGGDVTPYETRMDLNEEIAAYQPTEAGHKNIVDRFTEYVAADEELNAHRTYVKKHGMGFGENAFHWMWHLLVDQMPRKFKMLEIGVFKGQVVSLVALLAQRQEKDAEVWGIGTFVTDNPANPKRPFPEHSPMDTYALCKAFDIPADDIKLTVGSSHDEEVRKQLGRRKFNLVYIDGDHTYEGTKADIAFYSDKVAKGGYLVMDDSACALEQPWGYFKGIQSVCQAVDELLTEENGWRNVLTVMHNRIYRRI